MRVVTAVVLAVVVVVIALSPELRGLERDLLGELGELGPLAPVVLIAGYSLASLLFLPAFPLDLAAGAHFGFWEGVLWVQIAALVGSTLGYGLGRTALYGPIDRFLQRRPRLRRMRDAVEEEGWRIVLFTRLSPVFSFTLLNSLYGAARVPFWPYTLATFLGTLPGTALYVYAGEMSGDLAATAEQPRPSSPNWILELIGFVATAAVVIYVTRRAQRVLRDKLTE